LGVEFGFKRRRIGVKKPVSGFLKTIIFRQ